ncbi:uncharacterized protein EDB93DRAFT_1054384, partial [Suillus bovinus]|uniref:uncharacterized protein n=1 Tax=Suillus bovinus TaxID=48563 RepID=UPI001B86EE59
TRPKNATQHPRHILTEGAGKRCTTAQKAADDQYEREAKKASEKALQEIYQCIATLQAQTQAYQDTAHINAPKPKCPQACPVGKAAKASKASKTSNSTVNSGQEGTEVVTNKSIGTEGKGCRCRFEKLQANVRHPASEKELEEPTAKRKKVSKQVVRNAIQRVLDASVVIDGSTKAHDGDIQKMSDVSVSKKFALTGHIPGWILNVSTTVSRPASKVNSSAGSSIHPRSSSSALSKLTRGSTISHDVPPPPTP